MKRSTLNSLPVNPFLIWIHLGFKIGEMMLASAQVMGHRMNRMALAGPTPSARDQREFTLMGQEKIVAAAESAQAIAVSMWMLNQQTHALAFKQMTGAIAMMSLASSRTAGQSAVRQARLVRDTMANSAVATSQLSTSAARLVDKGLKPIHSRAKRNAKRLAKR